MSDKLAGYIIKFRWPILFIFVGVTIFFAVQIPRTEIDSEVKSMLPRDMPSRLNLEKIESIFGGTDMIMLVLVSDDVLTPSTLRRLKDFSKKLERAQGIDRVLSLFTLKDIRSDGNRLVVDPAVKRTCREPSCINKLRSVLKDNELVYGNVISKDFKAAATIGLLKAGTADETAVATLGKIIKEVPGPEKVYMAGMPYIRFNIAKDIRGDMGLFLPIGLIIMLLFLFFCFKQLRGVLLPFTVVVMSILFGFGLIAMLGWKIQIITILLPVILIAVANDYGIHILARYQENNTPDSGIGSKDLAKGTVSELLLPVLLTGVTTMAGLMCLLTHVVVPAKQLGILASSTVAFALLASLTFIPALLALLPKAKPLPSLHHADRIGVLEKMLHFFAGVVVRRSRALVISSFVVAALVATGISLLVVDTNPVNYYPKDAPVAFSSNLVDQHFGGVGSISIVAKGDVKDPTLLNHLDQLEHKISSLPEVGQTTSIAKVMRRINRVWNDNQPSADSIPKSREAVAQFFELYAMSGDPEDFERQVDFGFEHTLLTARINKLSTDAITHITNFIRADLSQRPTGMFPVVGGFVDILANLVDAVVQGQVTSLLLSLVLVGLLVMWLFRSLVAGLLAAIPLALSIILLFGLMGYFKIELNIATALLSSIMIGVGIDYTIHFLWRYRTERSSGASPADAIRITLTTTGRGITFNAISVIIGFTVVLISNFLPAQFFGFLVMVSIGSCLFGALGLLPAICLLVRPRFLEPQNDLTRRH